MGRLCTFLLVADLGGHPVHYLFEAYRMGIEHLTGNRFSVLLYHIASSILKGAEAEPLCGDVTDLFYCEVDLGRSESAHRTGNRVVGCPTEYIGVNIIHSIGAETLSGGPPVDPWANRQIWPPVGDHPHLDRLYPSAFL